MKIYLFVLIIGLTITSAFTQSTIEDDFAEGLTNWSQGNYKKAITIFNNIIESGSKNPEHYLARSRCYKKTDEFQKAYDDLNMAVKLSNMNAVYYYERGLLLESFGGYETEAIDDFTMARNYTDTDSIIFKSIYHRASLRSYIRDFDNSYIDFWCAYKLNPNDKELLNDFAMLLNETGKSDSAILLLNKLIQLDTNDFMGYQNLAFVFSTIENYKESLKYFNKCFSLTQDPNAYLYNNRGYVKYKLNDFDGALKDINTSIKLFSSNSYAYRNRALIYIDQGKTEKACEDLNKAIELGFTRIHGDEVLNLYNKLCK